VGLVSIELGAFVGKVGKTATLGSLGSLGGFGFGFPRFDVGGSGS
jgi:hypothetical protein